MLICENSLSVSALISGRLNKKDYTIPNFLMDDNSHKVNHYQKCISVTKNIMLDMRIYMRRTPRTINN